MFILKSWITQVHVIRQSHVPDVLIESLHTSAATFSHAPARSAPTLYVPPPSPPYPSLSLPLPAPELSRAIPYSTFVGRTTAPVNYANYRLTSNPYASVMMSHVLCPGLVPHETMLSQFTEVASYGYSQLPNQCAVITEHDSKTLAKTKTKFDGLIPKFEPFTGRPAIGLLQFLATVKEEFETLHVSEAVALRLLSFYLKDAAKSVYSEYETHV